MAKSPHINRIRAIADGLLDMPASEQTIGHFQMAVREALKEVADELEKHCKLMGVG